MTLFRQPTCRHGHPWTPENTLLVGPDKRYRVCRACAKIRGRRKYRSDAAHRERVKAATRANYHAGKEKQNALEEKPTGHVFSTDQGVRDRRGVRPDYDGDWGGCYRRAGMDSGA